MRQLLYREFFGSFQLVETEDGQVLTDAFGNVRILNQCDELAFAFSKGSGTLFKHGSSEAVNEWAKDFREKMLRAGLGEDARDLVVISSRIFAIDTANRIISTTGYVLRVWRDLCAEEKAENTVGESAMAAPTG